jgi:hypothetical protein
MTTRYFIFDCQYNPVGNPKGYRTHRGAMQQASAKNNKLKYKLWQALENCRKEYPNYSLVYKIQALEV